MSSLVDIIAPDLPESVPNAIVVAWHKKLGNHVERNEVLVEIETDKVLLEVPAPADGVLEVLLEQEGAIITARQVLGYLRSHKSYSSSTAEKSQRQKLATSQHLPVYLDEKNDSALNSIIYQLIDKHHLNTEDIKGSGTNGRITSEDIEKYITRNNMNDEATVSTIPVAGLYTSQLGYSRNEKRVPMTQLHKRMAERLLEAKNSTAMLSTFNEVNMKPVINLRTQYSKAFEKRHGIRIGFMSFYIKAVVEALRRFPKVNASIDGEDIVYYNYFDISIAISTPRGLVTPVLKDINTLSMADIEKKIKELAFKGRNSKLQVKDLTGGNFTISNGGIFGSLMSTPIINPPQSAILGTHSIKDRPMAVNGQVVILPMMYLTLSYDHRLIDGKESVSFLVTVKEILEDPIRLLLDV